MSTKMNSYRSKINKSSIEIVHDFSIESSMKYLELNKMPPAKSFSYLLSKQLMGNKFQSSVSLNSSRCSSFSSRSYSPTKKDFFTKSKSSLSLSLSIISLSQSFSS